MCWTALVSHVLGPGGGVGMYVGPSLTILPSQVKDSAFDL